MNLYNLKIFIDAARSKSMTRAAELNFVSRPTVSHAIKNLEAELGLDLLIHKPRTFELTPHGLSLFDRASKLLEDVNQMKSSLKLPSGNVSGFFRVGCVRSLTTELLPRALTQLRKQYPGLCVRVTIANSEVLMQYLDEGKIEMALILGDDTLHGAQEIIIDKGSFVVAIPADASPEKISFAITERRPETERARTLYRREYGEEMQMFAEIPSWDAILNWIKLGQCGGVIPKFLLDGLPPKKLKIILPKVFPYEIKAVYKKTKYLDHILKDFVIACRDNISS